MERGRAAEKLAAVHNMAARPVLIKFRMPWGGADLPAFRLLPVSLRIGIDDLHGRCAAAAAAERLPHPNTISVVARQVHKSIAAAKWAVALHLESSAITSAKIFMAAWYRF
jgi:hypothetical protein